MRIIRILLMAGTFGILDGLQVTSAQPDSVKPTALCGESEIYFDGACRGEAYFNKYRESGNEIIGYSGCANRPGPKSKDPNCGSFAIISEEIGEDKYRSLIISEKSPLQLAIGGGKKSGGTIKGGAISPTMPSRRGKAIVAQNEFSNRDAGRGALRLSVDAQLVSADGNYETVSEQNFLMTPYSPEERNQDHDVSGTLCVKGGLETENEGDPTCTCRSQSYCGLGTGSGRIVTASGTGFDYCEISREFDEELNGVIITELDLKLTRIARRVNDFSRVPKNRSSAKADGMTCYSVSGYANSAVLQAYSESENPDGTCKGSIKVSAGLQKQACRAAANGFARSVAAAETLGNASISTGSNYGQMGDIVNNVLAAADGYKSYSKRAKDTRRTMGPVCASIGQDIASAQTHVMFCDVFSTIGCEGMHSGMPIIVTRLSDGHQCEATADIECTSTGDDDASLISDECQCDLASEPVVNESTCTPAN